MPEPMSYERLEEIRANDAAVHDEELARTDLPIGLQAFTEIAVQRRELVAEVDRLSDELDAAQSSSDQAAGQIYELLHEKGQHERSLRAIALIAPALGGGREDTGLMRDAILAITRGQDPAEAITENLRADWTGTWTRTAIQMLDQPIPKSRKPFGVVAGPEWKNAEDCL